MAGTGTAARPGGASMPWIVLFGLCGTGEQERGKANKTTLCLFELRAQKKKDTRAGCSGVERVVRPGRARASRRESEAGRRCCGGDVAVCDRWLWRCCCVGRCSARLRSTGRESTSTSGMTSAPSSAAANGTARLPQSQRRLRLRRERGRATMGRTGAAGARRVLGLASSSVSEPAHPLLLLHCRCRITRLTTSACREAAGGLRRSPPIGTPI